MMFFAENLVYLKKKNNLTWQELSDKSGVSLSSLKRYAKPEHGKPSYVAINDLAKVFECTAEQLINHNFSNGEPPKEANRASDDKSVFRFFEGQSYKLYYFSEKKNNELKSGTLSFDKCFDNESGFLHGKLVMHHDYECRLETAGGTLVVYGKGVDIQQQIVIVLHRPDFGKGKTFKYRGGIGIVVHKNTHGVLSAQRLCLISKEMDKNDEKEILKALTDDNCYRITVDISDDSDFSQWILKRNLRRSFGETPAPR